MAWTKNNVMINSVLLKFTPTLEDSSVIIGTDEHLNDLHVIGLQFKCPAMKHTPALWQFMVQCLWLSSDYLPELLEPNKETVLFFSPLKGRPDTQEPQRQNSYRWNSGDTGNTGILQLFNALKTFRKLSGGQAWLTENGVSVRGESPLSHLLWNL